MPTSAAQAPRGDATSKQDDSSACNWLFADTADFIYTRQNASYSTLRFFFFSIIKSASYPFVCSLKNRDTSQLCNWRDLHINWQLQQWYCDSGLECRHQIAESQYWWRQSGHSLVRKWNNFIISHYHPHKHSMSLKVIAATQQCLNTILPCIVIWLSLKVSTSARGV